MMKTINLKLKWIMTLSVVAYFINIVSLPWGQLEGTWYTCIEILLTIRTRLLNNVISDTDYFSMKISIVVIYTLVLVGIGMIIRMLLIWMNKRVRWLEWWIYFSGFVAFCMYALFSVITPGIGFGLCLGLLVLDFLIVRFLEEYVDLVTRLNNEKKVKEAKKEEERIRLYMSGRYGKMFIGVIWKNFKYNWQSFILLWIGSGALALILYSVFGILLMTMSDELGIAMLVGNELLNIVKQLIPIIMISGSLLLGLIINAYIKTRMGNYGIFSALGTRKNILWNIIRLEFLTSLLGAYISGCILGRVLLSIFMRYVAITANGSFDLDAKIFICSFFTYIILVLSAILVNYHIYEGKDLLNAQHKQKNSESIPQYAIKIRLALGIAIILFSGPIVYWNRGNGESMTPVIWTIIGGFLIFISISTMILKQKMQTCANDPTDVLNIISWRNLYRTNYKFWYLLFIATFLAIAVYLPNIACIMLAGINEENELLPYDYQCMAYDEDEDFFNELQEKYNVDIVSFPMIRVTSPLGEKMTFTQIMNNAKFYPMYPQGQHIGISETTYIELQTKEGNAALPLNLVDDEMHVVFQQSLETSGHPLEWYSSEYAPFLREGQPIGEYTYAERDEIYPSRNVVSYERAILTGMYQNGSQENIIVYSDEAFESLEDTEGPTILYLLKVDTDVKKNIGKELELFAIKHIQDSQWDRRITPYYNSYDTLSDISSQYHLKYIMNLLIGIGLLMSSLFIFYIRYGMESEELRSRFYFLKCMGMSYKRRIQLLDKEMNVHIRWSYISGIIVGELFGMALIHLRLMSIDESFKYIISYNLMVLLYSIFYFTGMKYLMKHYRKRIIDREYIQTGDVR